MGIGKNANLVRGLEIQEVIRLLSQTIFFQAFGAFFLLRLHLCSLKLIISMDGESGTETA